MSEFNLGRAIRDLRRKRSLSGEELAHKTGFSQSKISRIETGTGPKLKSNEVVKILNILEAPKTILQQAMTELGQPNNMQMRRLKGHYPFTESLEALRATTVLRSYSINIIPALLQTVEYRTKYLNYLDLAEDDLATAMHTTIKRQDLLWDKRLRSHFIVHESALYAMPGDRTTQPGQLDRLDRFVGNRTIKLGILAYQSGTPIVDISSFAIYDERLLAQAVVGIDILSRDASDIANCLKVFAMLDQLADYEDSARMLIRKAIDYFS